MSIYPKTYWSLNMGGINDRPLEYIPSLETDNILVKLSEYVYNEAVENNLLDTIYEVAGEQYLKNRFTILHMKYSEQLLSLVLSGENFRPSWFSDCWNNAFIPETEVMEALNDESTKTGKRISVLLSHCMLADYWFTKLVQNYFKTATSLDRELFREIYTNFKCDALDRVRNFIQHVHSKRPDMVFLQEVSSEQYKELRKTIRLTSLAKKLKHSSRQNGTVILYSEDYSEEFTRPNVNGQTVYIGNSNRLYVNVHFTAKKPKDNVNNNHVLNMYELLAGLEDEEREVYIVGDFNHDITAEYSDRLYAIPKNFNSTVYKLRSALQTQLKKAYPFVKTADSANKDGFAILLNDNGQALAQKFREVKTPSRVVYLNGYDFNHLRFTPLFPEHPHDHALVLLYDLE